MKQHRYRFFISITAILSIVRTYLTFFRPSSPQICCHSTCFTLELAQTNQERQT
ncbi:MAG: hypothetical protein LBU27_05235 [Candidatus Peribacteria bacterium]|nr:hypothetical protein [Candidatus Peribacteria bacterium]